MICSPAEIEQKRKEALEKLARKKLSPIKLNTSSENLIEKQINSPKFNFKNSHVVKNQNKSFEIQKKPYQKPAESSVIGSSKKTVEEFFGVNKSVTTTLNLVSSDKFSVSMSSYSALVVEVCKTIPSRNYDSNTRTWSFHFRDYDLILSKLNTLKNQNVKIVPLPTFVIRCLKASFVVPDIDISRLDPELAQTLLPFQLEGLRFGVERNGRCLIADDMGLGKTFQALAIMNYYKNDWPLLVVTTASMKNVWEETICKYLPSVPLLQIQYMTSARDYIGDANILIVSHDLVSRCCEKLLERNFGCLIIDESHMLKNYKTKLAQTVSQLAKKAKRIVLLSGTPALSRPNELFTQLNLIDSKFFGSFIEYAKRYCDLQHTPYGLNSSGQSNLHELEVVLAKKFMIRRTKEEVMGSIPKKVQEVIKLDVHLEQFTEEDKNHLQLLASQYSDSVTEKTRDKHALLLTFFSETAKIKIPSVCSYISEVLERKVKFLVFAHHLIVLDAIEEVVKRKNLKYIRIDGSTTCDQRKYFVDKFQADDSYVCAVLSITAANAGITLTAAKLVIFSELHWNPSILSQAEARAHRIGQENAVVIQYLLADGTADDSIWPMLQEKQKILSEVGLCKTSLESIVSVKKQKEEKVTNKPNLSTWLCNDKNTNLNKKIDTNRESLNMSASESTDQINDNDDAFNDGLDEVLCNIEI